jgi:hypothetical protein
MCKYGHEIRPDSLLTMISMIVILIMISDKHIAISIKDVAMSTTRNLRLIHWISAGLNVLFAMVVVACVAVVLITLASPWLVGSFGALGSASVPVMIGAGDTPHFGVSSTSGLPPTISSALVEEGQGTLRLETSSLGPIAIANAAKVAAGAGLAYILWLLRGIVRKVGEGDPFAEENGRRMRRLGYGVLVVGLLVPGIQYLAAREILSRLPLAIPAISPGPVFDNQVILISLLILALAHIWSYGMELERDRRLTI